MTKPRKAKRPSWDEYVRSQVIKRSLVLLAVILFAAGVFVFALNRRRPQDPMVLQRQARAELSAGDLEKAESTIEKLGRQNGASREVQQIQSDLLTAQAMAGLEAIEISESMDGADDRVRTQFALTALDRATRSVELLNKAMNLAALAIGPGSSSDDWQRVLEYHQVLIEVFPRAEVIARSGRLSEVRLEAEPNDGYAKRLRAVVALAGLQKSHLGTAESMDKLATQLLPLDDPIDALRFLRHYVRLSAGNATASPDELALIQHIQEQIATHPADARWQFCGRFLDSLTLAEEAALIKCVDQMGVALESSAGDADWDWLEMASHSLLSTDLRPVWKGGHMTSRGQEAVKATLLKCTQHESGVGYQVLAIACGIDDRPVGAYELLLRQGPASNRKGSPAQVLKNWHYLQQAKLGLIDALLDEARQARSRQVRVERIERANILLDSYEGNGILAVASFRAKLLAINGQYHAAAAAYKDLFEQTTDHQHLIGMAAALFQANERGAALAVAREALATVRLLDEDGLALVLHCARALMQMRDFEQAEFLLDRFEQVVADVPAVRQQRAELAYFLGQGSNAYSASGHDIPLHLTRSDDVARLVTIYQLLGEKNIKAAAGFLLNEKEMSPASLSAWGIVLRRQSPIYESWFFRAWTKQLGELKDCAAKDLMVGWHAEGDVARLLGCGPLLLAAREPDPDARILATLGPARLLGVPTDRLAGLLDSLSSDNPDLIAVAEWRFYLALTSGKRAVASDWAQRLAQFNGCSVLADLEMAQVAMVGGEMEKAATTLKGVISAWPFHSDAQSLLGRVYRALGEDEAAIGCFEVAAQVRPGHEVALGNLFELYNTVDRVEDAMRVIGRFHRTHADQDAVDILLRRIGGGDERAKMVLRVRKAIADREPDNLGNRFALAQLYESQGKMDEAEEQLRNVADRKTATVRQYVQLALFWARTNRATEADGLINRVIKKGITRDSDWLEVADYCRTRKNAAGAEMAYAAALKQEDKSMLRVTPIVGALWFSDGRHAQAQPLLEEAWRVRKNSRMGLMAAECALLLGDADRAEALANELADLNPGAPFLIRLQARIVSHRGERKAAVGLLGTAISRWPRDPANYIARAKLHVKNGVVDLARRDYQEALRLAPGDAAIRLELGQLLLSNGEIDQAEAVFVTPSGEGAEYVVRVANLLMQASRHEAARGKLERAVADHGESRPILQALMAVCGLLEDYRDSAKYARRLLELGNGNSMLDQNNLAYYLAMGGDAKEALPLAKLVVAESEDIKDLSFRAGCLDTLGLAQLAANDYPAAIYSFQQSLTLKSTDWARLHLVHAFLAAKNTRGADVALEPLVALLEPSTPADALNHTKRSPLFRLSVLETMVRTSHADAAAELATEYLADDAALSLLPEFRARLLGVLALASFTSDQKDGVAFNLRQSIQIHKTVQAFLCRMQVDPDSKETSAAQVRMMLDEKPNLLLQLQFDTR